MDKALMYDVWERGRESVGLLVFLLLVAVVISLWPVPTLVVVITLLLGAVGWLGWLAIAVRREVIPEPLTLERLTAVNGPSVIYALHLALAPWHLELADYRRSKTDALRNELVERMTAGKIPAEVILVVLSVMVPLTEDDRQFAEVLETMSVTDFLRFNAFEIMARMDGHPIAMRLGIVKIRNVMKAIELLAYLPISD